MINILISQIDEHNESNILATKEFNPEVVYLIKDKSYLRGVGLQTPVRTERGFGDWHPVAG